MNPFRLSTPLFAASLLGQSQPLADDRTIKIYDVRDLVRNEAQLIAGAEPPAEADRSREPDPVRARLETLAACLRTFVQPPLGRDDEITPVERGYLVVAAPLAQHAFAERFFEIQRRERGTGVFVDARFVSLPAAVFDRDVAPVLAHGAPALGDTGGEAERASVILEAGDTTDRFVQGLLSRPEVRVEQAPRLLAEALRTAEIFVGSQVSYIKDFQLQRNEGSVIADPVVDVVRDGDVLRIVGARLEEGRLGIDVRAEVHALQRPIPTFTTDLGAGAPVSIQLPRVQVARISTAVVLPERALLLLALPPLRVDRRLVVLVSAIAVPRKAAPAPADAPGKGR